MFGVKSKPSIHVCQPEMLGLALVSGLFVMLGFALARLLFLSSFGVKG